MDLKGLIEGEMCVCDMVDDARKIKGSANLVSWSFVLGNPIFREDAPSTVSCCVEEETLPELHSKDQCPVFFAILSQYGSARVDPKAALPPIFFLVCLGWKMGMNLEIEDCESNKV